MFLYFIAKFYSVCESFDIWNIKIIKFRTGTLYVAGVLYNGNESNPGKIIILFHFIVIFICDCSVGDFIRILMFDIMFFFVYELILPVYP